MWAAAANDSGSNNGTHADIYYAPISGGAYVDPALDVYVDDPAIDLPSHSDLRYDTILDGTVQTRMRLYASRLVKKMKLVYLKSC